MSILPVYAREPTVWLKIFVHGKSNSSAARLSKNLAGLRVVPGN
jgi:hypothetical protein